MKKLLIISPYFPPANTPDMQRIRMSLPYFEALGWQAEVVSVNQKYADANTDELLTLSVPANIKLHTVKAFLKKWTVLLGVGNIAIRSWWFYKQKVNQLLKNNNYDLIYFSTTQFTVCTLGAYWKKRFKIPYVIDMQDPWYATYYDNKPKAYKPPKYRLTYGMHKYLEPLAIKNTNGLISVSAGYIDDLKNRYPEINNIPSAVIAFGTLKLDLKIAADNKTGHKNILDKNYVNIVYAGRGGMDMYKSLTPFFRAIANGLKSDQILFERLSVYFIGTSYAPGGLGIKTIIPLAKKYGIENQITEITDRISYYHALSILQQANALFIPGSDDPQYSASKIYAYLLARKPLLAILNPASPLFDVLKACNSPHSYSYEDLQLEENVTQFLKQIINKEMPEPDYNEFALEKFDAEHLTALQCELFEQALTHYKKVK